MRFSFIWIRIPAVVCSGISRRKIKLKWWRHLIALGRRVKDGCVHICRRIQAMFLVIFPLCRTCCFQFKQGFVCIFGFPAKYLQTFKYIRDTQIHSMPISLPSDLSDFFDLGKSLTTRKIRNRGCAKFSFTDLLEFHEKLLHCFRILLLFWWQN